LRAGDVRAFLSKYSDLALAGLVVAIVGMMIVPLPTPLLDFLISVNIATGVVLLLVAIYVSDALKIATFPTLLLLTTLFRLALEVSATRLILLRADAGEVIRAFGNFVVAGNLVVGAVVFLILTMIQFIVISKGSERVAEVAARFTLDAMPGKQMSIDAELRAGHIDHNEARRRRTALARESQLFGSMDGAMKFVNVPRLPIRTSARRFTFLSGRLDVAAAAKASPSRSRLTKSLARRIGPRSSRAVSRTAAPDSPPSSSSSAYRRASGSAARGRQVRSQARRKHAADGRRRPPDAERARVRARGRGGRASAGGGVHDPARRSGRRDSPRSRPPRRHGRCGGLSGTRQRDARHRRGAGGDRAPPQSLMVSSTRTRQRERPIWHNEMRESSLGRRGCAASKRQRQLAAAQREALAAGTRDCPREPQSRRRRRLPFAAISGVAGR